MPQTEPGTPRWNVLLALAVAVLGAHLVLLADGLPGWPMSTTHVAPMAGPVTAEPSRPAAGATSPDTPPVPRVMTSTVRWIVPPPKVATRATPDTPRPRPKPVAPKAPAAAPEPEPIPSAPAVAAAAPPPAEPGSPPPASEPVQVAAAPAEIPPTPALNDPPVAAAPSASPGTDAVPPLPSAVPPGSVELKYDVTGKSKGIFYNADARLSWQPSGTRYTAELEISAFLLGSRVRTSTGRVGPQGLEPERFGDRRRSNEKAAHFDHAGQRIRYSNNAPDTPLLPGAQDQLSVFLQLAALMQARPDAYPAGRSIQLQVAGTGNAEVWTFLVGPEEALTLPAGSMNTRRLTRPPQREYDKTVEVWLAPGLQHLPVRIQITEHNGDVADQQLSLLPQPIP